MSDRPAPDVRVHRWWEWLSAVVVLGGVAACAAVVIEQLRPREVSRRPAPRSPAPAGRPPTPFLFPGITTPPVRPAAQAELPDEAEVIGVSAGGRHRAYALSAFTGPMRHVVNDLVGDVPVTVTYCDLDRCTQVFTDPSRGKPLQIELGGQAEYGLFLRVNGVFYAQESAQPLSPGMAPFPYRVAAFERTTWKHWRESHLDTDVYVGDLPPALMKGGEPAPP